MRYCDIGTKILCTVVERYPSVFIELFKHVYVQYCSEPSNG